jgi:hypothetical protein
MYVVEVDSEFQDVPALLATLGLDETMAVLGYPTLQNRLAPLGGPNQMVNDQVYPVFVSLIFHPCSSS